MARSDLTVPQTYAALRTAVEAVVIKGRRDIEQAWIHTYHETGRLITEHLVVNKNRTGYGTQVLALLATDTGIDRRTLQQCAQFYRYFRKVSARSLLTWAHYRLLCQVDDAARRSALQQQALREQWTSRELEEQVRTLNATEASAALLADGAKSPPKLLTPKRGTPGVCKVIAVAEALVVDLGFATYRDLPLRQGSGQADDTECKAGDFVRIAGTRVEPAGAATKADLFTYLAAVLKVVDGDTLWVKVYLEPGRWVKQKLRLRDIDCPELATAEGKVAKRFTEALVTGAESVTICTTKPDKYDRYLADVFLETKEGETVFLNNALLANGHAVVKRAWEFSDWEEK